jgi:adenosine/AMP kinase
MAKGFEALTCNPRVIKVQIEEVPLEVPDGFQLIIGQSHFIKTVEDIYETLVSSMPGAKFGVAFCESSGKALTRFDGTDKEATKLASAYAMKLSAGHCFVVILHGSFPINVLNRIRNVDEVVGIYCATANRVVVLVADIGSGRGILGVVDGVRTKGLEDESDKSERKEFLRKIGYKK